MSRRRKSTRESESEAARAHYRPELDCLRFFAFLAVFLHHFGVGGRGPVNAWLIPFVNAGAFGVDLFFALSAFLITELFVKEIGAFGSLDIPAFYIRRLLRIWPLYFGFLAFAALVPKFPLRGEALVWFLAFGGNWFVAVHGYTRNVADLLWSVSIEEQFYLTWPLILAVFGVRRLVPLAFALLATAWATRFILVGHAVVHPGIWCNSLAHLDPIAMGILLATVQHRVTSIGRGSRFALLATGTLGLGVSGALNRLDGPGAQIMYPVVAVSCSFILAATLGSRMGRSRAGRLVAYLGKISYGLYVFHVLMLRTVRSAFSGWAAVFVLSLLLTIGTGVISYELFEVPILRLKRRFTRVPSRPLD